MISANPKNCTRLGQLLAAATLIAGLGTAAAPAQSASSSGSYDASPGSTTTATPQLKSADKRLLNKMAEQNRNEIALSQLAAERAGDAQVRGFAQELLKEHSKVNRELLALAGKHSYTIENVVVSSTLPAAGSTVQVSTPAESAAGLPQDTGVAATGTVARDSAVTTREAPSSSAMTAVSTGDTVIIPAAELNENRAYRSLSAKSGRDFDKEYADRMVEYHKEAVDTFKDASKDADAADIRNFASSHIAALQEHLDKAQSLRKSLD